jgi:hypothetical protein
MVEPADRPLARLHRHDERGALSCTVERGGETALAHAFVVAMGRRMRDGAAAS